MVVVAFVARLQDRQAREEIEADMRAACANLGPQGKVWRRAAGVLAGRMGCWGLRLENLGSLGCASIVLPTCGCFAARCSLCWRLLGAYNPASMSLPPPPLCLRFVRPCC